MSTRTAFLVPVALALALALAVSLAGCASTPEPEPAVEPEPAPASGDAAGLRLAPGLYDQDDGTVMAIGTLEYRDLEGGFWAIVDYTAAAGEAGTVAAVIANGPEFADQLEPLEGAQVTVLGTRLEGASIRMAGPEIEMTSVEEITDTGGVAE